MSTRQPPKAVEICVVVGDDAHAGPEQTGVIEEAFEDLIADRSVRVRSFTIHSPAELDAALVAADFSVVHLLAHGNPKTGKIQFKNDYNQFELSVGHLARIFAERRIKIVVLSVCHGEILARALEPHVHSIVATSKTINPETIIEFSRGFYRSLAAGESVADAFHRGKSGGVGFQRKKADAITLFPEGSEPDHLYLEPDAGWRRPEARPTDLFLAVNTTSEESKRLGRLMIAHLGETSAFSVAQLEPGMFADDDVGKRLAQAKLVGVLVNGPEQGCWGYYEQIAEAIHRAVTDTTRPRIVPIVFRDTGHRPYGTRRLVPLMITDEVGIPRAMQRLARLVNR